MKELHAQAPSFAGYKPSSETASRAKRANRSRDTKHEVQLRKELWHRGLRFRVDVRDLPGRPDIVFARARTVVFCDGDFWHGRNWTHRRDGLRQGHNGSYWSAKIEANRRRDSIHNRALSRNGWRVIRLWETDILRDPVSAANAVQMGLTQRRSELGFTQRR